MDTSFIAFLLRRVPITEVSTWFPRHVLNATFQQEVEKVLESEEIAQEVRNDLLSIRDVDLVGYVDSSLRRSGFKDFELDELVSDILIKLLVTPRSLFRKWDRKSPMSARLKVAIRNSIITLAKTHRRRARRSHELPDDLASRPCLDDVGVINAFRDSLRSQHGDDHVRVLDTRLAGNDIKGLIGSEGIGTAYRLKTIVQDIKGFAVGLGDECLQRAVKELQVREEETLAKRFGRVPAGG